MNGTEPPEAGRESRPVSDLRARAISAAILMVAALAALWVGGFVFALFVALAVGLVLYEWTSMSGPFVARFADKAAIAFVALSVLASRGQPLVSVAAIGAVAVGIALYATVDRKMGWLSVGVLYAGLPGVAAVALRGGAEMGEASHGLIAIAFVFGVVWATDTGAYFAGRNLGGPKLAPRFSPKKTWSGAIGGLAAAVAVGLFIGSRVPGSSVPLLGLVAAVLSIVSQVGDIAESAMKRHFGVKDSGRIIPGHGGIMDRVDGLVVAMVVAAGLGLARTGGADAPAGLLIW